MNSPAEIIARYRSEHLGKIYDREQEAESLPGMQELRRRKKELLALFFYNAIHGVEDTVLQKQISSLESQEAALIGSTGLRADCPQCGDTGVVGGTLCSCLRDRIYHESYGAMNIQELSESFEASDKSLFTTTFKCANGATQKGKYTALEKYAKEFAESYPLTKKQNLFLTGNTGLGKTFVLRCIAKHVHQKNCDVMLLGAPDLFSIFYRHRLGEDVELSLLSNCGLLLIDDLGIEPLTNNVTVEYFLDLLNRRIDNAKHTVIATNLSTDGIVARYGERVYSRIRFKDICDQLVFEGQDIRIR